MRNNASVSLKMKVYAGLIPERTGGTQFGDRHGVGRVIFPIRDPKLREINRQNNRK
jgi:hypothetical protein